MAAKTVKAEGWHLLVREPCGQGKMREVVNHWFDNWRDALPVIGKLTKMCQKPAGWSLLGEGDVTTGLFFCAWPFFGDFIAPVGTDFQTILEVGRGIGDAGQDVRGIGPGLDLVVS